MGRCARDRATPTQDKVGSSCVTIEAFGVATGFWGAEACVSRHRFCVATVVLLCGLVSCHDMTFRVATAALQGKIEVCRDRVGRLVS